MEVIFWILIGIVLYSYFLYGIMMGLLSFVKEHLVTKPQSSHHSEHEPEITLFVAAYNEKDFIQQKVNNSFSLNYPSHKIKHLWVTDGSDDGTPEILRQYDGIQVIHKDERQGKIGAINRGMQYVTTPIIIFSDCNTMLSPDAIRHIVEAFKNPQTGCVAGEKRISQNKKDIAVNAGEGFYWKYESYLKKWESHVNSAMGAVGELFAIRKHLFSELEPDTILDDFMISMGVAQKGYKISYVPQAYAVENASISVREELKRKVRIAAGGIQAMLRLTALMNLFKYPVLGFQFISHKVLRWTIIPLSFPLILILNIFLSLNYQPFSIYHYLLFLQILFYLTVLIGHLLGNKKIRTTMLFIPYYLFFMNYAVYLGLIRYLKGKQSHNWERAKRM